MSKLNVALSAFYLGALTSFIQKTIKDDAEAGQVTDIRIEDKGSPYLIFETPTKIHKISISVFSENKNELMEASE